jgi:putative hemolysin
MDDPRLTYASPDDPRPRRLLIRAVERLTGQRTIERLYAQSFERVDDAMPFWTAALDELDITMAYDADRLARIPSEGPVLFVANHPYGVLDGLVICHLAAHVRPRFRILINRILCREERIASHLLPIDFGETPEAGRVNLRSVREAIATLRDGGAIVIFPAGGISTADKPFGPAIDPFAARLIQQTKATVVPVYFHGQNSRLFQWASKVSQTLRLALIIRELERRRGSTVRVAIGEPLAPGDLPALDDGTALTRYLRAVTHDLATEPVPEPADGHPAPADTPPRADR